MQRFFAPFAHAVFVAAIHGFAFPGDKDIFTLRKKDTLAVAGPIGETEKFEGDGRWRRQRATNRQCRTGP